MKKKNLSNNILKSLKYLNNFNKNKKFNPKKNHNFIHMYLLYIQNNYDLDLGFKNFTKEKEFTKILKYLYKNNKDEKNLKFLFKDIKLLGELFYPKKEFNLDKFLHKLENSINSTIYNYSNIEILDYLGNTENDINIINHGYCLILLKELYPNIKFSKNITKIIYQNLNRCAKIKGNLKYINTQAVMLLFILKKIKIFTDLDQFVEKLIDVQQNDGRINNGFNSFLISNSNNMDTLHTIFNLIVLLEYKILKKNTEIINKNTITEKKENNKKEINKKEVNKNISKKKLKKKKIVIEKFDNILLDKNKYYIDLNFYNVSALCIIIIVLLLFYKLKDSKIIQI